MIKPEKIIVLHAFDPYLRILKAYNPEKFKQKNQFQILQSICLAFGVTILSALIPIWFGLAIWSLADKNTSIMRGIVVAVPLLFTIIQLFVQFVAFEVKNQNILETIDKLQATVDQRKFY